MEFFAVMAALKDTPRRGWEQRGVPSPESVSDHMYQMAQICLVYPWVRQDTVPALAVC